VAIGATAFAVALRAVLAPLLGAKPLSTRHLLARHPPERVARGFLAGLPRPFSSGMAVSYLWLSLPTSRPGDVLGLLVFWPSGSSSAGSSAPCTRREAG